MTASNYPISGKNRKDVHINNYRNWTESGKDEEHTCKEKSASELNLSTIRFFFILFHLCIRHNFLSLLSCCGNINKLPNNKIRHWFTQIKLHVD
jgi:hypothetical protein